MLAVMLFSQKQKDLDKSEVKKLYNFSMMMNSAMITVSAVKTALQYTADH